MAAKKAVKKAVKLICRMISALELGITVPASLL